LAQQVTEHIEVYSHYLDIKSFAIYGGRAMATQSKLLKEGIDILVATPGRAIEHIGAKNIDLKSVDFFILDEADTILDMGFLPDVSQIVHKLKDKRQNILLSATLSGRLKELSSKLLVRPTQIELAALGSTTNLIKQVRYSVLSDKKLELLSYLIGSRNYKQVLVFVRKKQLADEASQELRASGLSSAVIHGDKSSGARARALNDFKEKKIRVLVATDIAARGLDIKGLDVVISYDIPHITQDFIHRIGRTGRAGREGLAITLTSPEELVALKSVEQMLGKAIRVEVLDGYSPTIEIQSKGARKKSDEQRAKIAGAFGKKRGTTTTKKRKTTKRDGFKSFNPSKKKSDKKGSRAR
jgi:ATP-dependent RNA helicase RhlE